MKHRLLMCAETTVDLTAGEEAAAMESTRSWGRETSSPGVHVDGNRLEPPEEARTLRVGCGELMVTDGPFAGLRTIAVRPFWPLPL